jgi:hypothetical protein
MRPLSLLRYTSHLAAGLLSQIPDLRETVRRLSLLRCTSHLAAGRRRGRFRVVANRNLLSQIPDLREG